MGMAAQAGTITVTALVFVLAALCSFRLTRLITTDTITDQPRRWLLRRFPARVVPLNDTNGDEVEGSATLKPRWLVELVNCDWCLGVWVSAAVVGAVHGFGLAPDRGVCVLAWGACSAVVGAVSDLLGGATA